MVHLVRDDAGIQVEVIDSGGRLKPRHLERKLELRPTRGMGLGIIQRIGHDVTVDHPGGHSRLRFRVSGTRGSVPAYGPFGRSLDLMARSERLRAQAQRLAGYTADGRDRGRLRELIIGR
ncbi:ATP-binding protein [Nonomuraea sp. PA05]|uniref:ATP-binding protein n=1 Tax=Nonomuraea sp. PA05 TaxID=2604466 RepID=UPI0011D8A2F7|nr:ATP-binding protein [Nonomuraea sp. PA05]TYB61038.1 ATP-binding protein [Nonomuraea sp. PA05]